MSDTVYRCVGCGQVSTGSTIEELRNTAHGDPKRRGDQRWGICSSPLWAPADDFRYQFKCNDCGDVVTGPREANGKPHHGCHGTGSLVLYSTIAPPQKLEGHARSTSQRRLRR